MTVRYFRWRWPTARPKFSGTVNALYLVVSHNDEGEFLIPDVNIQHTQSTPAVCTHIHLYTHTHTSVHGHLFVRMWLSWIRCAHMTASVKCGFGWQRKEGLYLWNSKSLHATALRGENAKLACHGLVEMSFPYVWRAGSVFSSKKICSLAISMAPAILLFFFNNTFCSWISFSFEMRDFGGGGGGRGAVSFSRVYQAPELGCISDFTQGKSKLSAAVDSGEAESAHLLVPDSQKAFPLSPSLHLSLCLSPHLSLSVLNLGVRVKLGRQCEAWGLDGPCCCAHPANDLQLIGVGGNVLAKLWWGSAPVRGNLTRHLSQHLNGLVQYQAVGSEPGGACCHLKLSAAQ